MMFLPLVLAILGRPFSASFMETTFEFL